MSDNRKNVLAHLDQQIDAMMQVLTSLNAESEALVARDADALETALGGKTEALKKAAELEQSRLSMQSVDTDSAGVSARWDELLELTRQCQAKNIFNGNLIRGQRRRVEDTLHWLRGDVDAAHIYGPDGERGGVQTRATLASV